MVRSAFDLSSKIHELSHEKATERQVRERKTESHMTQTDSGTEIHIRKTEVETKAVG